jgi:hypothetical protein
MMEVDPGLMADQLVDFLRNRKEHAPATEIDWQSKRDSWVRSVEGLYDLVREMLRPSIGAEDVIVRTFDEQMTEELSELTPFLCSN